jgi:threonine synthase
MGGMLFPAAPAVVCLRCGVAADESLPLIECSACGAASFALGLGDGLGAAPRAPGARSRPPATLAPPRAPPLDPAGLRPDPPGPRPLAPGGDRGGVWRFRDWLPVSDDRHVVSLGEGDTPVVALPRWGGPGVFAKLEHFAPTGSFKDRGMTLTVSHAKELGATAIVEDSSGNAGASAAAYAARAGMRATIYAPASAPEAKLRQIASFGAEVIKVLGPRDAVTDAAIAAARKGDAYYVGHNVNPFFSFGMTTFAYELPEVEHVVMPAGGGSLYVGCWLGLKLMGAKMPRLHLVQPTGCAPIVAAQAAGADEPAAVERRPTIAGGAEIERPARGGQMLEALRESGGIAVAVDDAALVEERRRLARLEGIDVEPTAALALAGFVELRRRGVIRSEERVLVVTTGVGLKVPDA